MVRALVLLLAQLAAAPIVSETVERLLGAPSMGQFFKQYITRDATAGHYACRLREPVQRG